MPQEWDYRVIGLALRLLFKRIPILFSIVSVAIYILSNSPSDKYSGLISFRMDWLDLHAVQGTLKSLFQHLGSKPSILRHSAFFLVQLSHPYVTTGKIIALTRRTFVGKVLFLLFNNGVLPNSK